MSYDHSLMYLKMHLVSLISFSQKPNFYGISLFETWFKVALLVIDSKSLEAYRSWMIHKIY